MARNYYELLPYIFKRFSVLSAFRTGLPTVGYYLTRKPLPASDKPALFTMNILPPMMTVWYHCVRKYLGDSVDVTIFDCSGWLKANEFPGARVQKFLNLYAASKSEEFIKHIAKNRKIAWISDDDVFPISADCLSILDREFKVPKTASVSFKPRTWWHFDFEGKTFEPSGSYCIAFDREIYQKEKLSLAPCNGNTHVSHTGKALHRFDTADKANEILLSRGYRCAIVPEAERDRCVASFTGMSGAVMLLHYYKHKDDVLKYFHEPKDDAWSGTTLYGMLSAMLAVQTIQECYTEIKGRPYMLPSLPSPSELAELRKSKEPLLGRERSFQWVDDVSNRLKDSL